LNLVELFLLIIGELPILLDQFVCNLNGFIIGDLPAFAGCLKALAG
jgi:hypothetical protein